MQSTSLGSNLTGAAISPASVQAMNLAADDLTPVTFIDTSAMEEQKLTYIAEADAVGSVPAPASMKGLVKTGVAFLKGGHPTVLMDKLGERIAFERTGTRLYDALSLKYKAVVQSSAGVLPPAEASEYGDGGARDETPEATIDRIRAEELEHFKLLCDAVVSLGGDPTAVTPCADVAAVASSGLMQVLNDPRTTLAQCLSAMLTAEMTDNAGWELLIQLAEEAGETELVGQFLAALGQEQEHLSIIKNWLTNIVAADPAPSLV